LHPMKVDVPDGSVTAIIGPVSSGKSTLLNFLAGSLDHNLTVDGFVNLPGTKSFLPQETCLHSFYTPRTYIMHYDRLTTGRLKGEKSNEEIDHLLGSLGIMEERRDTIVGDQFRRGLSEGEKRRLNLGLMVLGAPDTLFCHEPLGGLDSETSLRVMEFLKGYASHSGRRVILTIDQASSFIWTLLDNVILLSKGQLIYEGPRFDMESFFAHNNLPTPKRFNPIEHYIAAVCEYRNHGNRNANKLTIDGWAASFKTWQQEADRDEGDALAADEEVCFPASIQEVVVKRSAIQSSLLVNKACIMVELVKRYSFDLWLNPGILWIRLAMYSILSLFIGLLFYDLGDKTSYMSIQSRAAILFYSVSFYTLMVLAVIPFRVYDRAIMAKEVFNGYYHPILHHFAVAIGTLPGVAILAFFTTTIMVSMTGLRAPCVFFLNMLLSLFCAESIAQMVSIFVKNYINGIAGLAGIFGLASLLQGFMLVPTEFPVWLRWAYNVPFHTYSWRSFMFLEFSGDDITFSGGEFSSGMDVLRAYDISEVNTSRDMVIIFCYGLLIHLLSTGILFVKSRYGKKLKDE